jgi:hypothetical protein
MLKGKDNWMEPCVDFDSYLIFKKILVFFPHFILKFFSPLSTSDIILLYNEIHFHQNQFEKMNIDHAKFNIHNSITKYLSIWDTNAR